jgi:predicted acylesterase/phospholipase RssA
MSEQVMDSALPEIPRVNNKTRSRRGLIRVGVTALVLFIIGWVFFCTAQQLGWKAAMSVIYLGVAAFYVMVVIYTNVFKRLGSWPAMSLGVALSWILWIGSYDIVRDIATLTVLFVLTMLLFRPSRRWMRCLAACLFKFLSDAFRNLSITSWLKFSAYMKPLIPLERLCGFKVFAVFLMLFWCISSGLNHLNMGAPLKRDETRFTSLRRDTPWKGVRVGLALSGGGYRAALVHAGVLDAFEKLKIPVAYISSVSGGSIISSFYAAGGKPEDLRDAVIARRFNLTRNVTDVQNALRLPFPFQVPGSEVKLFPWYSFARSEVQVSLLDKVLLDQRTLADLGRIQDAPRLMVCTTDLCTGAALGISEKGIIRKYVPQPTERDDFQVLYPTASPEQYTFSPARDGEFPRTELLARLVTASGAFPGAFSAVPVRVDQEWQGEQGREGKKALLADGGITDNTALTLLLLANAKLPDWDMDIVFASDASALFSEREDFTDISELSRAIDIVYANVGVKSYGTKLPRILLSPATILDTSQLHRKQDHNLLRNQIFFRISLAITKPDKEALGLIINSMPDGDRKTRIRKVLESVKEHPEEQGQVCHLPSQEVELLKNLLADDLFECVDTFLRASTLRDQYDREDAVNLFRLGHYITALDWPVIKQSLNNVNRRQPQPDNTARGEISKASNR